MPSSFLSSILSRTSQVLGCVQRWAISPSSSSNPRSRVLEDLKKLERTLKRIQAALHDAEEREIREEAIKLWLEELKEVAYDAEDVLDEYHYEELRAQAKGRASRERKRVEGDAEEEVSDSVKTMVISISDDMGDRIREIRERFDEISEDRKRLRLREEDGRRRVVGDPYPAPTSHMVDESSIYGRVDEKEDVINLVFSEGMGKGISVIPIVGKGGLGKTTIAQLVYNDSMVKEYFDRTGWVCVSDDFGVPRLTIEIIESLTKKSCDLTQLSMLQDTLKEEVKGKKVLIVLDDVWNEQQSRWESLRIPFVGAETVRIIMTCRDDSVAQIMKTVRPYHPDCLSLEQSWSLFRHYAFAGRDPEEQPCLARIGKQIVSKCAGLPLAVKTIGSLLRHDTHEDSWMEVLQSDLWELDSNNETLASLRLSYIRMPAHLKPCFIYCSMFPKDYMFDKDVLVKLWMAQGYILPGGGRRMEDIGDEYFNSLQRRSFFDSFRDRFFKMHDMIHDLAKSIAGHECYAIVDNKPPSSSGKVRHLYLENQVELVRSLGLYDVRALRTLFVSSRYDDSIGIQKMIKLTLLPRYLRVLKFSWYSKNEISDFLGNLKHLRYLYIHSRYIHKLPESVCLLYHLQTLKLKCDALAKLPSGIGSLTNLRHLDIRYTQIYPVGINKLTNLQILRIHRTVHDRIGALEHLVKLPALFISGLRNVFDKEDAKDAGLKHKHELWQLFLYWNAVHYSNLPEDWLRGENDGRLHLEVSDQYVPANEKREEAVLDCLEPHANLKNLVINGYGGSKFPKWMGNPFSFPSLRGIQIIDCKNVRYLSLYIYDPLEKLDAPMSKSLLKRVCVSSCQQLATIAGLHNLHSLKNLKISNCPQLRLLSKEGLPSNLEDLYIEECQQLTSLPGMQNVTSLGALTICNCPQLQVLSEEGLPFNLKKLYIRNCQQLKSLLGMQNLTSLTELIIQNCPKLQLMEEDQLSSMPRDVEIIDCPGLANWCLIQNIDRIQVILGNELIISNSWVKIKQWLDDLTSTEQGFNELSTGTDELLQPRPHLCFSNSWRYSVDRAPSEPKLTIWGCSRTSFPGLRHLPRAKSVRHLVVKDCPGLRSVPTGMFPFTLRSLIVDSCEDLGYLMMERKEKRHAIERRMEKRHAFERRKEKRHAFEQQFGNNAQLELQLVNCPNLTRVVGLNSDFVPKTLRIERCPELLDWLQREQLMEPKKLNCVMTEHAVSPLLDAVEDGKIRQFLQLGLPSGSNSHPLVQIIN